MTDVDKKIPKNTIRLDCGCLLYVNNAKHHGVTLHCKEHRTKAEVENDEEGLQEKVWWLESEIERLRAELETYKDLYASEIVGKAVRGE